MIQIKTFDPSTETTEAQCNRWLSENPDIEIISIHNSPLYDFYSSGEPSICNQWIRMTVVYKKRSNQNED
jgi:hypothetical protein